jgi:hypothetical protein
MEGFAVATDYQPRRNGLESSRGLREREIRLESSRPAGHPIYTIEKNEPRKLFAISNLPLFHRKLSQEVVDSKGALKNSAKLRSSSK